MRCWGFLWRACAIRNRSSKGQPPNSPQPPPFAMRMWAVKKQFNTRIWKRRPGPPLFVHLTRPGCACQSQLPRFGQGFDTMANTGVLEWPCALPYSVVRIGVVAQLKHSAPPFWPCARGQFGTARAITILLCNTSEQPQAHQMVIALPRSLDPLDLGGFDGPQASAPQEAPAEVHTLSRGERRTGLKDLL